MIKNQGLASSAGQMEGNIQVNGTMENKKGKANISMSKDK